MSDVAATATLTAPSAQQAAQSSGTQIPGLGRSMWSHGGFSFKDLLDIVNPLQHLPVVGSVYRYLTGDEPSAGTRIIGDGLYGGPIGFGVSVASTALLTDSSGKDLGEQMLTKVFGSRDHDSDPTVGTPQVATTDGQSVPAPEPEWMASAGTPDGQPRTPAARPARDMAGATLPATPPRYVASAGKSIAAVSAPARTATPAAAAQQTPAATATADSIPVMTAQAQSVPMNQLFRSPPAPSAATPEQTFANQAAAFQRQISQGRGSNGAVLNGRAVPLELSSNLLPVMPAGGHLSLGAGVAAQAGVQPGQGAPATATPPVPGQAQAQGQIQGPAKPAAANAPDQNAIAQKMIDALNKYQVLKKQEQQQDSSSQADSAKVDLSL